MKEAVRKRQDRKERTPAQIERYLFYWLVKNLKRAHIHCIMCFPGLSVSLLFKTFVSNLGIHDDFSDTRNIPLF